MKTSYFLGSLLFSWLCVSAVNAQSIDGATINVNSVTGKNYEITDSYNSRIKQEVKDILAAYKPAVDSLTSPIVCESAQIVGTLTFEIER